MSISRRATSPDAWFVNDVRINHREEKFINANLKEKLSQNALTVVERPYLKKGKNGRMIETPEEMFLRVAVAECVTPM